MDEIVKASSKMPRNSESRFLVASKHTGVGTGPSLTGSEHLLRENPSTEDIVDFTMMWIVFFWLRIKIEVVVTWYQASLGTISLH